MTRLMEYLNEGIYDKGIFKACFMSGSAASGKSYVISKISSGSIEPRIVNSDTWTEYYMKFEKGSTEEDFDWDGFWSTYKGRVKQLTKAQLVNYLNSMLPMWIDSTSTKSNATLRRKGILQSLGYDVAMVFVDTPVDTAIKRNKARGRTVPEEFLVKAYKDAQNLKKYYASEFRHFTEILNGEGELIDKVILDAYKKMSGFFTSKIENPIGKRLKEEMIENGWKYLVETPEYDMQYLKKLTDNWFRN